MADPSPTTPALQDRYNHAWIPLPGETDLWWSPCKGVTLPRRSVDAEAGPLLGITVTFPVAAPATVDREEVARLLLRADQLRDDMCRLAATCRETADLCDQVVAENEALRTGQPGPAAIDDLVPHIARVLIDHTRVSPEACACGWGVRSGAWAASHAEHVARAVIDALREVPRG